MSQPKRMVNVGVAALAREVGLSQTTISKKLNAGMTPDQIRQEHIQKQPFRGTKAAKKPRKIPTPNEYDLIVKGRERINQLDDMKYRRAKALAERSELDNALRRGELIPVTYVRRWGSRFLTDARDTLMTGPSELQDALAAEADPVKCAALMRAWLERVMAKFQQVEGLWGNAAEGEQVA